MKNHYQTLRLRSDATSDEIKKSYRKLAQLYHPDKNAHSSGALIFHEVHEAYSILSDAKKKKLYDEERYFAGLTSQKEPQTITAAGLLNLASELNTHTQQLHTQDINHQALYAYVQWLLSDVHITYLDEENATEKKKQLTVTILNAVKKIEYSFYEKVTERLMLLTKDDEEVNEQIKQQLLLRKKESTFEKWIPFYVVSIVLLVCLIMYWYGKK